VSGRAAGPLEFLAFLLSSVYDNSLDSQHRADLHRSGLSDNTIERQRIRTVPPDMIEPLLGFPAPQVRSAYVLPFADPRGGWMDHVRLKVFGDADAEIRGAHVVQHRERWRYNGGRMKYLVCRRATPRLFFPLATMTPTLAGTGALWAVEGPKKALAMAQLGFPVVGIESAFGWHLKASRDLLPDFDAVVLARRIVKIAPDPDMQTAPQIARTMHQFAEAVERRGARVQIVRLPGEALA
jgi:hypothetical protein